MKGKYTYKYEMHVHTRPCIAGSDGHKTGSAGRAGIAAGERIRNNDDLVRILKSKEYTIYVKEQAYGI